MTTAFQRALAKIIDQEPVLKNADERAVELGVILPLLRSVGWDTEDIRQIYPQHGFENNNDKIDYALKIDGDTRVFLEAKRWKEGLTKEHEKKLRDYCNAATTRPKLAALTNGCQWRLYLATDKSHPELRKFLEFDVIVDKPTTVEKHVKKYLSYEKISNIKSPVQAAHYQHRKLAENNVNLNKVIREWNKATHNRREQDRIIALFAQAQGIDINIDYLRKELGPMADGLFNPLPEQRRQTKSQSKPTSFTLGGSGKRETIIVKYWYEIHFGLCKIMYERHPHNFSDRIVEISEAWFSKSPENHKDYLSIEGSGVWVKKTGANAQIIKNLCDKILDRFDSSYELTIKEA